MKYLVVIEKANNNFSAYLPDIKKRKANKSFKKLAVLPASF
jgi:hypothetical protein